MRRQSLLLLVGLLMGVIGLATVIDLVAPTAPLTPPDAILHVLPRVRPEPDRRPGPRTFLMKQLDLPRATRSLATVAALTGYGFLLRAAFPNRIDAMARSVGGSVRQLLWLSGSGIALLLLLVTLTLLAAISIVAGPLVPLFSFGAGIALLTGVVLVAMALGRRLRGYLKDWTEHPLLDLCTGLLAVMLLALIPLVGTFLFVGAGVLGIGTLLQARLGA